MKFYTVLDLSKDQDVVAIILESESGQIAGLAASGSVSDIDSAASIIHDLFAGPVSSIEPRQTDRILRTVSPNTVGFVEAALYALRPPLAPGPLGHVIRTGSPTDMLERVWSAVKPRAGSGTLSQFSI